MSEDDVVGETPIRDANAVPAIIISRISNAKWTKDGLSVCVDLTDQHGTTRTFAWAPEIANHLIVALSSGIAGCHKVARGG
jgi:hypothetical protein